MDSNKVLPTAPTRPECPVCGGAFVGFRHAWLFICANCGLLASSLEPRIPAQTGPTPINEDRRAHGLADIRARNNDIVLDRIRGILGAGSKQLLDVGSGLGFFLSDATERGFTVSGVEPDASVVEQARARGVPVRHGYFPHCLEPSERFDVIVFNDVLEHVPDLGGVLDASTDHLAPGGLLVLNCPNRHGVFYQIANLLDRAGIHGPFDRMWQREISSPHVWYFKPDDLRRLGEKRGLRLAGAIDLLPITLRGIVQRIFYVRNQSMLMSLAALFGTLLLLPFLSVLPRDISVVLLQRKSE